METFPQKNFPQKNMAKALLIQTLAFAAWGISWRVVSSGIESGWIVGVTSSMGAVGIVTLLAIVLILATIRFLKECDDFQRKCHLNAMSLAAGVGFTGGASLMLAHAAELAVFANIGIGTIAAVMFVTYIAGSLIGHARAV